MRWSMIAVLLLATFGFAADPAQPKSDVKVETAIKLTPGKAQSVNVGKKCIITIETTAKKVTWKVPEGVDYVPLDGKRIAVWADTGVYKLLAQVPAGDDVLSTELVLTVIGPRPPPGPAPEPKPDDPPKPPPVAKSFRVIFVVDPLVTPEPGTVAAMDAEKTRDYLSSKTTADQQWAGWRKYNPRANLTDETETFKALWTEVLKSPPKTNAVVIEVDGKIYIEPIPKSSDDLIALFKAKNGGK